MLNLTNQIRKNILKLNTEFIGVFVYTINLNILESLFPFANSSTNLSRYLTCLVIGF